MAIKSVLLATFFACTFLCTGLVQAADPLPSWHDGAAKQSIIDFVTKVTKEGSADFVPPAERIATFDNDGTLWAEQPLYFQLFFALDRVQQLAPQHPEWKDKEPFTSLLKGDVKGALFGNSDGDLQMLQYTTGGTGARFGLLVHHTDAAREWAYDGTASIGHLDKALDAAPANGWTVVDMKEDWKVIYPTADK